MKSIHLDGLSLNAEQIVAVAYGASVALDAQQLIGVAKTAAFLSEQVQQQQPLYGVSTGFGSNADKLLGAHHIRASRNNDESLLEELQRNLIITHAVCVGEPFAPEVVRAMMVIRINTLMRGHSGIRVETLQALTDVLNAGIVPVIPQLGSVGASGDLAPLSHLAIVLLGGGEAFYHDQRMSGQQALDKAELKAIKLSHKEGLALNNGTAQMLATGVLAVAKLEELCDTADLAAAMTLDAFAGRMRAFDERVHALRPHPGQVHSAQHLQQLLKNSSLVDIPYHLVPKFRSWQPDCWPEAALDALRFDISWDWVPLNQRHGREKFYQRFKPFRGGKKHQPQDSYSLRCIPQVHGAVRDALAQAKRVFDIELNSVTDNPLIFPDLHDVKNIEDQIVSAGHFHGMPLALVMSYVKAAIPVLASISERRLNKLLDSANNDGLPAFLIGNEDGTESGFMIVQYTAAAIVNDLASRAHPASVYSIPTSANAEDHVSMGANEARHVLAMATDLAKVIALELYTAAQALDFRKEMINAARTLAANHELVELAKKIHGAPLPNSADYAVFLDEVAQLRCELAESSEFIPGQPVAAALQVLRQHIAFMTIDRAMDAEVQKMVSLVENGTLLMAARSAL